MSNPNDKNSRVVVGWLVDVESQRRAIQSIQDIEKQYQKLGKAVDGSLVGAKARFEQSRQAAAQLKDEMVRVDRVAEQLEQEFKKLGRAAELEGVNREFATALSHGKALDTALQDAIERLKALGATDKELAKVARQLNDIAAAAAAIPEPSFDELTSDIPSGGGGGTGGASSSRGRSNFSQLGSRIRGLPSIPIVGSFSSDAIGNILRVVGSDFAAVAGGIGITSVALQAFASAIEATAEELKNETHARYEAIDTIRQQTTAQAEQTLREAQVSKATAEARLAELNALRAANNISSEDLRGNPLEQAIALVRPIGELKGYTDLIAEQEQIVRNANVTIAVYNNQIEAGATNINDFAANLTDFIDNLATEIEETRREVEQAAEAERRLSEATKEATRDRAIQANLAAASDMAEQYETEARLRAGTVQQAQEYHHALQVQTSGLHTARQALIDSGDTSEQVARQIEEYTKQIQANENALTRILLAIVPYLAGLEAQAAALDSLVQAGQDAIDAEHDLIAARRAMREEQERHLGVIAQIIARETQALQAAETTRTRALENLEAQSTERVLQAVEKAHAAQQAEETRHLDTLRKIRETFAKSARQAAASLDAKALQDAIETRDAARKDETREHKSRQQQINRTLEDTTRDIERNLDSQRAAIQQRYDDQVAAAVNTANQALAIENAKYVAEIAIRQQALNIAISQYQAYLATIASIAASQGRNIVGDTAGEITTTTLTAAQAQAYIQAQQPVASYAGGTRNVPMTGIYRLHEGEGVRTRAENRAYNAGGGRTVNMGGVQIVLGDIGNRTDAQVEALVERGLRRVLEREGG